MTKLGRHTSIAITAIALSVALLSTPAAAEDESSNATAEVDCADPAQVTIEDCTYEVVTVVEKTYSAEGDLVMKRKYGDESEGKRLGKGNGSARSGAVLRDSGSGGSTSASGCRKVTVNNRKYSFLGALMYTWQTWTDWCWTRSNQRITSASNGSKFIPDNDFLDWSGTIDSEIIYYDYSTNDGHPRSAYKHWRQGKVANVVLGATTGTIYPENLLRSYYNGTWVWETKE